MQGIIIKAVAGEYLVKTDDGILKAKARGRFRREGTTPQVGDAVQLLPPENGSFYLMDSVLPRKNALVRPPVSNVDTLILVTAVKSPEPDLMLTDSLIIYARSQGITPVLLINKADLDAERAQSIAAEYNACGITAAAVSVARGEGIDGIIKRFKGVCCLAGQSAAGKSSLLSLLIPDSNPEIGGLSRKTDRGKNTTRHCELYGSGDLLITDTPGFSLLEQPLTPPEELTLQYEEYRPYNGKCRFDGCSHTGEPGCAVAEAVANGVLPTGRHQRYIELYRQTSLNWRNRYD